MLTLFKSNVYLKDLLADDYIDIHSHVLPGLDDGAKTFEDSLSLINSLQSFGTSQIITTPHVMDYFYGNTKQKILNSLDQTTIDLRKKHITIPFRAAAEYMIDDTFVALFKSEKLMTLKDNYVLIEMSYINPPIQLYSIIFDLQVAGYIPVLAHPERYGFLHYDFEEYNKLINSGCLFQLNLLSIVGYYGLHIAKIAKKLLKNGMYSFVGSDVHHDRHINAFSSKVLIKDIQPLKEVISNNNFFKISLL